MKRQTVQRQRIGPAVRRLRRERGLTLDDLAAAAGVSPSHLSRLERSQTLPSFPVLAKIAQALDVDVNEFVRLEQDVTRIDQELVGFLQLLAIPPDEGVELLGLSIEARRSLVERLHALAEPVLTPQSIQDKVARVVTDLGDLDGLAALSPMIRDAGMTGTTFTRALLHLDQMLGRRVAVISTPSLLPLAPGTDLVGAYRLAFGEEALDPAAVAWWRTPRPDFLKRGTLKRPVRAIVSSAALQPPIGTQIASSLLDVLRQQEAAEIAITDHSFGPVNMLVVDGTYGVLEQLPRPTRSANGRRRKHAALWIIGAERALALSDLVDHHWDRIPDEQKDSATVMARLQTMLNA